jgi:hypothetical protein
VAAAKQAGGRLFEAVFSGAIGEGMRRSMNSGDETLQRARIPGTEPGAGIAAFSENGYDPRSFGGWVRRGWIARDGDRRYLTDQGRQWVEQQETGGKENWRLIIAAARALTAAGQTPFTRQQVYERIWERHQRSDHERPSLDPAFQGMISNAPGGPASAGGTPLQRIRRGLYVLAEPSAAPRAGSRDQDLIILPRRADASEGRRQSHRTQPDNQVLGRVCAVLLLGSAAAGDRDGLREAGEVTGGAYLVP